MGTKLEAFRMRLSALKKDDPAVRVFTKAVELLSPEHAATPYHIPGTDPVEYVLPTDNLDLADEIHRLRDIKKFAADLSTAADEYVAEVEGAMLEKINEGVFPRRFESRRGFMFGPTNQAFFTPDKDQGGTGNPALKEWLKDNGMPDVAEGTINYQTLQSSVGKWMIANPIEAEGEANGEAYILEGAELLEELGIDQEEFDRRAAEHARLKSMVAIGHKPKLSVNKA